MLNPFSMSVHISASAIELTDKTLNSVVEVSSDDDREKLWSGTIPIKLLHINVTLLPRTRYLDSLLYYRESMLHTSRNSLYLPSKNCIWSTYPSLLACVRAYMRACARACVYAFSVFVSMCVRACTCV